jgi:monofunctional glycosyltransferase
MPRAESRLRRLASHVARLAALLVLCALALQAVFLTQMVLLRWVDPPSTPFQRSEAWRLLREHGHVPWKRQTVALENIAPTLQRAVIASEDAGFVLHRGVDWAAIEAARERNRRVFDQARRGGSSRPAPRAHGGSTLTQQLAKNLWLSGERTLLRKGQEMLLALAMETVLDKRRLLELYLNQVEWGEGVFGAEAAAWHHHGLPAAQLTAPQAARLAVMLPAPKRYERRPNSAFLAARRATIQARMGQVVLP